MNDNNEERISRATLYIASAYLMALRGTCKRMKVGCVITSKDNRIIATGYNGSLDKHCISCDLTKPCTDAIHAEANAIAYAAKKGILLEGSIIYCTHSPCIKCAELIIQAGIKKVIYSKPYRDTTPKTLLEYNMVEIIQIQDNFNIIITNE
jgi:dCMP deaminase